MSLWNDFLDNIAIPVGKSIAAGAAGAGKFVASSISSPAQAIINAVVPGAAKVGVAKFPGAAELSEKARKNIAENMAYEVFPQAESNDILLRLSAAAEEKVFSKMTRTVGTAALLTDPNSPLYQADEYEKGFQTTDIKRAWKKTEEVSAYQAITKSAVMQYSPLAGIQSAVLNLGNIDINEVNLWDPDNVQKNYVDNPVGRWYTGLGDFVAGNAAVYGGTTMIAKAGLKLFQLAGLSTKAKKVSDFESEINDGIIFNQTGGAKGRRTVAGDEVYELSKTQDLNYIQQVLIGTEKNPKYTNNDNLLYLIREADDPAVIRDYILADKLYMPALERLATTRSSNLAELADLPGFIRAKNMLDDQLYHPQGDALARIRGAFDDVIAKNPEYVRVRDAFFNEKGQVTGFGREGYFPIEPKIGTALASKVRGRTNQLLAASKAGDFSKVGGIAERVLGSGRPNGLQVRLVKFVGSYKPLGYVTFSGARANDGLIELDAFFDDMALFRDGQNKIQVAPGEFLSAADYRNAVKARWVGARSNIERKALLDELDEKLGIDIARTLGISSPEIKRFVQDVKNRITQSQVNISRDGFAMDYNGRGVVTDPYTQSQLVDSHRMVPWNIIEKELARAATRSRTKRGKMVAEDVTANVLEQFNKYWTFDVLARPSYIPKQSIFEPVLSAGLGMGFGRVMADAPMVHRNFIANTKNRVMERASRVLNAKDLKAVNTAVEDVSSQLDSAIQMLDNLYAEADEFFVKKNLSPATLRDNSATVKQSLKAAENLVDKLELELRDAAKPYASIGQVPTIANLERRIKFLESISKGPETKRELFPGVAQYKDGGSGGLVGSRSTVGFVKTSALKDMSGNVAGNLEAIASYRRALQEGKGFAIREFEGKPFNDPIMVVYDNETGLAYVGEGNHRLQAALAENIPYVPVRVVRGRKSEMVADPETGRLPKQIKNNKEPQFVETTGSSAGQPVSPGYVPPEMHPSYVFDKRFLVEKDEFIRPTFSGKFGSQIANAKAAIGEAKGQINTLMPDQKKLNDVYSKIASIYQEIDNKIIKELGEARYNQAVVFGKSEDYKKRYYGKDTRYRMVNGQWMPIDSLFDENQLGTALRAEFENGRTVAATFLNELTVGTRSGTLMRKGPKTVTDVTSPIYFEELAYVANRTMRNDPLVQMVLADMPERDILAWGFSERGKAYASQFGDVTDGMIPDFIKDRIAFVNRYIPDAEAKALLLQREVTSVDLQRILSKNMGQLSAIHPIDFNYNLASEVFGIRGLGRFETAANKAMSKVWRFLTSPENPIRWNYADNAFADIVAAKANRLAEQGVPIDVAKLNSLRAASTREALQETERTFYSIRRQNRALFAARAFTAFPTATLNAFYRYGRFAIKNPARFAGFMHSYHSMFQSFGVDKYGNPTDDVRKVTHILVPGSKELGLFGGQGVMLNARSIGFLLNYPTPSFISAIPVAMLYERYPGAEDTMKNVLGASYDILFPYGPPEGLSGALASLTPSWARDFWTYANGDEGRKDYLDSVKSVANYYRGLEEMGIAKFPGMDQVRKDARELYRIKANWSASSIFGVPAKVETRPMMVFEQYYDILVNKYKTEGATTEQAKELAGQEFLSTINPGFPLDRITFKGSTAKGFVPASLAAWNRVMIDNPDLIKKIESNGLETLGLLTADLDDSREDFSLSVYRLLKDPETKLPTGTRLNELALTPEQEEAKRIINRTWDDYMSMRDKFEKLAIETYGVTSLRKAPKEFQDGLREYGNTVLKEQSLDWWKEWQRAETKDTAFIWGSTLWDITNDENFMKKYGKTKFWSDAKIFINNREQIADIYRGWQETGGKTKIRESYMNTMDVFISQYHPKLQEIIKRYFDVDTLKPVK